MKNPCRFLCLAVSALVLAAGQVSMAASTGALSGTVRDIHGNPLADLLVSLIAEEPSHFLPILTRTDADGHLHFEDVQAGTYRLLVKSASYESPMGRLISIEPGKTLGIRLVLQQILTLGLSDQQNIGMKSLLRSSDERRMIFRTLPGQVPGEESPTRRYFRNAAFRLDTNTGWGSPGDSSGGTTTNFAVKELLGGGNDYVIAGQIHSGQNSLWRIKNFAEYDIGENHSVQLVLGFSRLSYDQPSLPLLDNPVDYVENRDNVTNAGAQRILTLGISDRLQFGDSLAVVVGMEFNQVRNFESHYFASPSATVAYSPFAGSTFEVLLASKRDTVSNTVTLPDGQEIGLADAVYVSSLNDNSWLGRARYYQASFTQELGADSELQLAAFKSRFSSTTAPFLAFSSSDGVFNGVRLRNGQAESDGYRLSFGKDFGEHVKASFAYLRGQATGLSPETQAFVVSSNDIESLLMDKGYHAIATQFDVFVPQSNTYVTTLIKAVPGSNPLTTIDPISDVYETSNEGINLFVRQLIPVPTALLGFFGLDFLSEYTIEALLDIRNLSNRNLGLVRTDEGDFILVQNPRTVRGGIAFKF